LKILVTGSSGQVGTNLCLALQQRSVTVLGLDRRKNSWTDQIPLLECDLAESMPAPAEIAAALGGQPEMVVHLAANAKVHELVIEPRRAHENATSTFTVLEYCRQQQLPLIFSSSREVYGNARPPSVPEQAVDIFQIRSPYAAYKLADEMLIYAYAHCYGLQYLVFRLSNVYGRYDNDIERMSRVLHIFVSQMRRGEPITIFDRTKLIDFTYVDDCINGLLLGIQKLAAGEVVNETFNLSSGSPATLLQLAETVAANLSVPPTIIDRPIQPGEINFYVADLSKARQKLGFEPQIPFKEGIRRAIEWVLEWEQLRGGDKL
jgi:UDP-glucuronate 4-epimerase